MTKLVPFDAAKYLTSPEAQLAAITEAYAEGDAKHIDHLLTVIMRARGLTKREEPSDLIREAAAVALESMDEKPTAFFVRAGNADEHPVVIACTEAARNMREYRRAQAAAVTLADLAGEELAVDLVREWLMSTDHPVSDWERSFAAAITAYAAERVAEEMSALPAALAGALAQVHGMVIDDGDPTQAAANYGGNWINFDCRKLSAAIRAGKDAS